MSTVRHLVGVSARTAPVVPPAGAPDAERVVWLAGDAAAAPEQAADQAVAGLLRRWAGRARRGRGDVQAGLRLARDVGAVLPAPGVGSTAALWSALATLAATDLTVARVVEPHVDALAIMAQLSEPLDLDAIGAGADSTWGVFAAEGPGQRLEARDDGDRCVLDGVKPWCSLAADLSHAVVTAWTPSGKRRAFAVALDAIGVTVQPTRWHARGLRAVSSGPVTFKQVSAVPVGPEEWYLRRPGFAWGGMGVAACWYGGAVGVARALADQARTRELDQVGLMHLGAVDTALHATRTVLLDAAAAIDAGAADGEAGRIAALRVRGQVAATAEEILTRAGHALGPAPLCFSEEHAGRVADLQVYIRQEHAERDRAALGRALLDAAGGVGGNGGGDNDDGGGDNAGGDGSCGPGAGRRRAPAGWPW